MPILSNYKYPYLISAALIIMPIITWKTFFKYWRELKQLQECEVVFQKRHNCVVTYRANKGHFGWPPNYRYDTTGKKEIFPKLYEPIIYFISTTEKSLQIALMNISIDLVYAELSKACKRGVKIRIIIDFQQTMSAMDKIKSLTDEGAEYQLYVTPNKDSSTIMHNKFMIKDFNHNDNCEGYLCLGSMNYTTSSVLSNYESIIFTSNQYLVQTFQKNFDECWEYIRIDNLGLINKTILKDAHFIV